MATNMVFIGGEELKAFRKRKKYTQVDIAYKANVSQTTVSLMENNQSVGTKSWQKIVMLMLKDDKEYFEKAYGKDFVTAQKRACCWN